jgi:hypothetical protein
MGVRFPSCSTCFVVGSGFAQPTTCAITGPNLAVTQGFKGGGGGWIPPTLPPLKLAIRFSRKQLLASKDKGLTGFFKKGLREELAS